MIAAPMILPAKSMDNKESAAPKGPAVALLNLVETWLTEDDGYDVEVWPIIQKNIEANRLSVRDRFLSHAIP